MLAPQVQRFSFLGCDGAIRREWRRGAVGGAANLAVPDTCSKLRPVVPSTAPDRAGAASRRSSRTARGQNVCFSPETSRSGSVSEVPGAAIGVSLRGTLAVVVSDTGPAQAFREGVELRQAQRLSRSHARSWWTPPATREAHSL